MSIATCEFDSHLAHKQKMADKSHVCQPFFCLYLILYQPFTMLSAMAATSLSLASTLAQPMCGVKCNFSGWCVWRSGLSKGIGSFTNTSSAAPPMIFSSIIFANAASSMIPPRPIFTMMAVGFIIRSSFSLISPAVRSLYGAWMEITSEVRISSSNGRHGYFVQWPVPDVE